ncbi:MAG: hypothetical protein H0Z35_12355 [Thermoanaerobacteraceae bacterium]|nr:hypothetical protein [Thermoanaerobacteraceae bacterium]
MPREDLIQDKLKAIDRMIADLERNEKVIHRIGGFTAQNLGQEIAFQQARRDNLEWAATAAEEEIQQKIQQLESTLSLEEKACKYGSVRGLPLEKVKIIAMIEDLEIALGIHPGVK